MRCGLAVAALLALAPDATAEKRPQPGSGDPRIQSVLYDAEEVVLLEVAPGYQLTVQFSPDERIENVAVGDASAWQVTPNRRGDALFVKPLQQGVPTDLVVLTDARAYAFALVPGVGAQAFTVKFRYPAAEAAGAMPAQAVLMARPAVPSRGWRLSGDSRLYPARIEDDGTRITIFWPEGSPLPAVFDANSRGEETLVNGMMRDGRFVIDGIVDRLVFRLDRQTASARRIPQKTRN